MPGSGTPAAGPKHRPPPARAWPGDRVRRRAGEFVYVPASMSDCGEMRAAAPTCVVGSIASARPPDVAGSTTRRMRWRAVAKSENAGSDQDDARRGAR